MELDSNFTIKCTSIDNMAGVLAFPFGGWSVKNLMFVTTVVLLIGSIFFFTLCKWRNESPSHQQQVDIPQVGRFELKQISTFRRDQFLLDNATGRIWSPRCTKLAKNGVDCDGGSIWQEESVEGLNFKF